MHAAVPYDPVKAHDYYIRTRQLKGRNKGLSTPPRVVRSSAKPVIAPKLSVAKPQGTITEKRQAEVQSRVQALQGRLKVLKTILNQLVHEANGTGTKKISKKATSTRTKKTSSVGLKRKDLTATQKREAAKKQRVRYKKAHPNAGVSKDKERQRKIKEVKQKIEEIRVQLKAAIANARDIAAKNQPAATGRRNSQKG